MYTIKHAFPKTANCEAYSGPSTKMHRFSYIPTVYVQFSIIVYFRILIARVSKSSSLLESYPTVVAPMSIFQISSSIRSLKNKILPNLAPYGTDQI